MPDTITPDTAAESGDFGQIRPGSILVYKTSNLAKVESLRACLRENGVTMLPFERVMDDASRIVEETESSAEGNATLKKDELLHELKGLSYDQRRINMARALGYTTRSGHKFMRECLDKGQTLEDAFTQVIQEPSYAPPSFSHKLGQLLFDTPVYYAIDDTELVLLHPEKIRKLPHDQQNHETLVALTERLKLIDEQKLPPDNTPEIRVLFSDVVPFQGTDRSLANAIISTAHHIKSEKASFDTSTGIQKMITDMIPENVLENEIDLLANMPFPSADAADYYGSIGIKPLLHAAHRALGKNWDQTIAVSTTNLWLIREDRTLPINDYPYTVRNDAIPLNMMPWRDINSEAHGLITSLDDVLTPPGFPGISVGKSYPLMPRPNNHPLSTREKIIEELIDRDTTATTRAAIQPNNQNLDIALIAPSEESMTSPAILKIKDSLIGMGHQPVLYHLDELFPEQGRTHAHNASAEHTIQIDPPYQKLADLYGQHGIYVVVDPSLAPAENQDNTRNLRYGQLVSELLAHGDIGPNHDRGQHVIMVTDYDTTQTTSKQIIDFDKSAAARGYVKNHHAGNNLHIVKNGTVDARDILESKIDTILDNSMVRLGARATHVPDLSIPLAANPANNNTTPPSPQPSHPWTERPETLPVWQVRMFGSASKNNYHYQERVLTIINALNDEMTDQGIVMDLHQGNGRTGYMGFFADNFQSINGMVIPSYGETTPELTIMEAGGQLRSYRNGLSTDIRRRTNAVMQKIAPEQIALTILFDGGIGSLAEYYPSAREQGNSHVMIAMPESTMKEKTIEIMQEGGKTALMLNVKPGDEQPDLYRHVRAQIHDWVTDIRTSNPGQGVFMTKGELKDQLGALELPKLSTLNNWRDRKVQERHNPGMVKRALGG